jgi:hypothetical protein
MTMLSTGCRVKTSSTQVMHLNLVLKGLSWKKTMANIRKCHLTRLLGLVLIINISMSEKEAKEQFEILYKSAQGKGLEVLLKEILAHPSIYSFASYLEWPKIKAYLNSPDGAGFSKLTDIFSFGSYSDLVNWKEKDTVGDVNQKLVTKLRHLTLLSLMEKNRVENAD